MPHDEMLNNGSPTDEELSREGSGEVNHWLFQANPDKYDLIAELRTREVGEQSSWTVKDYKDKMRPGDKVIFWVSGKQGGIYALGELIGVPYERKQQGGVGTQHSYQQHPHAVDYRYTHILDEPLLRENLKEHAVLKNLSIFKFANATNFNVTPEQWQAVEELLNKVPAAGIDRASKASAREVLERLLPDQDIRRLCLNLLADSIEQAHTTAKASWSITLFPDRVRLNAGPIEVFVVYEDAIYLLMDKGTVTSEVRDTLRNIAQELYPDGYSAVPNSAGWELQAQDATSALPVMRDSHLKLVKRSAEKRKVSVWQKSHSPGVLHYLREFLGREIPDPEYPLPPDKYPTNPPSEINVRGLISRSLQSYGYHFTGRQIAMFYTALQTKGFVILSGISGTGKTKLAQHFAAMLPQPNVKALVSDDTISVTVQPYMLKYGRLIIPKQSTRLFDPPPPGEATEVNLSFGGKSQSCRLVHAAYSNTTYLSLLLRGGARQWFNKNVSVGETLTLEPELDSEQKLVGFRFANSLNPRDDSEQPNYSGQNLLFMPVRPDWRDSKSVLGYYNPLTGTYEWTHFLRFLLRAAQSYSAGDGLAWFVILDEMNLAHVEYYFADILSVMESGRDGDGWTYEPLRMNYPDEAEGDLPPREVFLPPNLYFIGTVNVDETTHAFSPKVLDRAFTIELSDVDFSDYQPNTNPEQLDLSDEESKGLLKDFTYDGWFAYTDKNAIADCVAQHPELRTWLQTLNQLLKPYNLHFGFRVFDEIISFVDWSETNHLFNGIGGLEAAFDAAVLMKILPKFHGSRGKLESPLRAILAWCANPNTPDQSAVAHALNNVEADSVIETLAKGINFRFTATARRAGQMLWSLYVDGFAAFG